MESLEREDSTQYCKVISLQLKFINLKKKKEREDALGGQVLSHVSTQESNDRLLTNLTNSEGRKKN